MVDFETFEKIQELRNRGFSWNDISRELGLSYMTCRKYYSMSPEEYKKLYREAYLGPRKKKGDDYREELIDLIKKNPNTSSAEFFRVLKEKYGNDFGIKESTLRRYIRKLREEIGVPNLKNIHIPKKYLSKDSEDE